MSKTEILLYKEFTEVVYSKIEYCTVLASKRNEACVAPLGKSKLVINRLLTATVQ